MVQSQTSHIVALGVGTDQGIHRLVFLPLST